MKKIVIVLVISVAILAFYKSVSKKNGISDDQAQIILFHGDGCPHCKIVSDYINNNKVESKVKIAYKEVYYNKTNQNLLTSTVKKCPEIDASQGIGVPLAFVKETNKCLYGDTPIIDYLKSQMLK